MSNASFTLSLSGTSSVLETTYFPPIELASDKTYFLGIVELLTFNQIPNIDKPNNKFYVGNLMQGADKSHDSDLPVSILKVNALGVECNITSGAYINKQKVHTIHELFPAVAPGFKIIEIPKESIYLPVSVEAIDHLQIRIVDQDGNPVNFRGETINIRLHIKSV